MAAAQCRQGTCRRDGRPPLGAYELQQLDFGAHHGPPEPGRAGEAHALLRHHPTSSRQLNRSVLARARCRSRRWLRPTAPSPTRACGSDPVYVTAIADANGNIIQDFSPSQTEVITRKGYYRILSILLNVVDSGTGNRLRRPPYNVTAQTGGKTGTTNDNADGWFMAFTPDLVSGTWVGGEDRYIHFNNMAQGQGRVDGALYLWQVHQQGLRRPRAALLAGVPLQFPCRPRPLRRRDSRSRRDRDRGGNHLGERSTDGSTGKAVQRSKQGAAWPRKNRITAILL